MKKNLICIPFAYEEGMNSGVNISESERKNNYLKNAFVALFSAKQYNPECDVALATNLKTEDIPGEYAELLKKQDIQVIQIPFEKFRFADNYRWSLAFYKLCVLSHIAQLGYQALCYMDTDVFIQGSFESIWTECEENILLYDIHHGMNTPNYLIFLKEVEKFLGIRKNITHYGGEFFAASSTNAVLFCNECDRIYREMLEKNFETTRGDEFILSIAASEMRGLVKNAGAYICRFWTSAYFRLVSTCYRYNRVSVLHMPDEKNRGMMKLYEKYCKKGILPTDKQVWKICRLTRLPIRDRLKKSLIEAMKRK